MTVLKLQFTQQGLDKLISAKNRGLQAEITHMAFGDSAYTPDKSQKALKSEKERVEISDYQGGDSHLRMAAVFAGKLEYAIREIGLFLADGTLLGVYSQPGNTLGYRTPTVRVVQWFTLNISALPTKSVTVVVGSDNLNLLLAEELAVLAKTAIDNMHKRLVQEREMDALRTTIASQSQQIMPLLGLTERISALEQAGSLWQRDLQTIFARI